MELKERIFSTAYKAMLKVGISSMTMDMVARECGISKRTLYETIPDKRTLVWHSVLYEWQRHKEESRAVVDNESNRLQGLLKIYLLMRENFKDTCDSFQVDLRRLYPDLEREYVKMRRQSLAEMVDLLEIGVEEKVFRADVNLSIATTLFFIETRNIKENLVYFSADTTFIEVCDMAFITFLRGISTLDGLKILDKFIEDNNNLTLKYNKKQE